MNLICFSLLFLFINSTFYHFLSFDRMQMRKIAEFKLENKAILNNLMPEDEKSSFVDNDVVNVLTNCDQDGRRVLIVHCGSQWDTKKVNSDQLFRLFYLIHVAAQVEPQSQVCGVVVIMDFNGMGLKQVSALSPAFSKRLLTFIQEAMPLRLKQVHMVNQPFVFNMVWSLFKPFVREKLKGRVSIRNTLCPSWGYIFSIRIRLSIQPFHHFRCSSMARTENRCTSTLRPRICHLIMAAIYQPLIMVAKIGMDA